MKGQLVRRMELWRSQPLGQKCYSAGRIALLLVVPLAVIAKTLTAVTVALMWRNTLDSPLMVYMGVLMEDFGKVPYRDFFDMNPPGSLLLHQLVVKWTNAEDHALRVLDMAWLLATQLSIFLFMKRWGWTVAIVSACCFGLQYLSWGSDQSFQREYLCILPICLSLCLAFRWESGGLGVRAFCIGFLFGGVVTVKPILGLHFLTILLGLALVSGQADARTQSWWRPFPWQRLRRVVAFSLLGFSAIPLATGIYLELHGALPAFREVAFEYWPLYSELRGNATIRLDPFEMRRFTRLLERMREYDYIWLMLLGLGAALPRLIARGGRDRAEGLLLVALCLCGIAYSYASGKFWLYHQIPLYFAYSLLAGLAVSEVVVQPLRRAGGAGGPEADATEAFAPSGLRWLSVRALQIGLIAALFLHATKPPEQAMSLLAGKSHRYRNPDIEEVAGRLRSQLRLGDTVQPLDVAGGGAVHAMLLARAELATPFIYDFHFYHHPRSEMTRRLRERMIQAMKTARPRFVVANNLKMFRSKGLQSAPRFRELDELIESHYRVSWRGSMLTLFERRPDPE